MKKIICLLIMTGLLLLLSGCVPPGQINKQTAPGQMKKTSAKKPVSVELDGEVRIEGGYNHSIKE